MCVIDVLKEKIWLKSILAPLQITLLLLPCYGPCRVAPRVTRRLLNAWTPDLSGLANASKKYVAPPLLEQTLCQNHPKVHSKCKKHDKIRELEGCGTGNSCETLPSNRRPMLRTQTQTNRPTFVRRFRIALRCESEVFLRAPDFNLSQDDITSVAIQLYYIYIYIIYIYIIYIYIIYIYHIYVVPFKPHSFCWSI